MLPNTKTMKELQKNFIGRGEVKNFIFTQLKASNAAYLYEVHADGVIYYEFFKRKENTHFNCISYPSSKAFGIWAWTNSNLDLSIEKFNLIC